MSMPCGWFVGRSVEGSRLALRTRSSHPFGFCFHDGDAQAANPRQFAAIFRAPMEAAKQKEFEHVSR
jgi:hypothetical protein